MRTFFAKLSLALSVTLGACADPMSPVTPVATVAPSANHSPDHDRTTAKDVPWIFTRTSTCFAGVAFNVNTTAKRVETVSKKDGITTFKTTTEVHNGDIGGATYSLKLTENNEFDEFGDPISLSYSKTETFRLARGGGSETVFSSSDEEPGTNCR
jgi:hypothetical protein